MTNASRAIVTFTAAIVFALMLAGAALRLVDLNWDKSQHVHPDERWIVWVADTIEWPGSGGLAEALAPATSPLNPLRWPQGSEQAGAPRNFAYGHFPLYVMVLAAEGAAAVGRWFGQTSIAFPAFLAPIYTVGRHLNEYSYMTLVARAISALADLGTLLVVFAMTVRLSSGELRGRLGMAEHQLGIGSVDAPVGSAVRRWVAVRQPTPPAAWLAGLLAAAAYTFAVLPIQLSHYGAVDALLTLCVTASVALAARYAERGGLLTWIAAGIMSGLAVGSKFSAVLLALPLVAAAMYAPRSRLSDPDNESRWVLRDVLVLGARLASVGIIAAVTFAVTNPFAILDFQQYVSVISGQNAMVSGAMDAPYTRQYIGTTPYWYFIQQLSQWGLGWPMGIAAWAGMLWAIVRFAQRQVSPSLVILLSWALPYFATTGAFHTKYLRYMAPLLPFLLAFAATCAVVLLGWLVGRFGRRARVAWAGAVTAVLAFSFAWAVTFAGVYRQEHPWISASLWMLGNVPAGSIILSEAWDDSLPLAMDGYPGSPPARAYERVELTLWDPDDAQKLDTLVEELTAGDYLVLASNRLYAPIPRLSSRYPMASQYYRMLFSGELGYDLVAEFSLYPNLGRFVIPDDNADESFTVYDHPHAFVFRNVARHDAGTMRTLLRRYLPLGLDDQLQPSYRSSRPPGLARYRGQEPAPGAPLTLSQPVDTLPVVSDFRWNTPASASPVLAPLLWWLVLSLLGWLTWPLLFPLLHGLTDRGYGLARAAGWLLLGWVHWMGVSLGVWQNRLDALVILFLVLAVVGRVAWTMRRDEISAFWRAQRRLLLTEEILFAAAFVVFTLIRLLNPDLWQPWNGGEKFMESAFLNAILRSPSLPPFDPYFAGGTINYYYYGLYLVSLPIKLTGIVPEIAFNLAVPALYALTAIGVFSIAASLAAPRRVSQAAGQEQSRDGSPQTGSRPQPWVAVLLTLVIGNLRGLRWIWDATRQVLRDRGLPEYDYWAASRVIPYTINEFPLWTFVFADLHPHMIAMPFGVLVAGLALNWLRATESSGQDAKATGGQQILNLGVLALAFGALGPLNTWDLPVYAILLAAAFLLAGWNRGGIVGIGEGLIRVLAVVVVAIPAYLPFYLNYKTMVPGKIGLVRTASSLDSWLSVWGFFLFVALSAACYALLRSRRATHSAEPFTPVAPRGRSWLFVLLGSLGISAILAALGRPTAALAALPLLLLLLTTILRSAESTETKFAALLVVLGLGIVGGTEVVYVRDFLDGGDWYRMNTIFKFSVPAWLFLGLGGGVMLVGVWRATLKSSIWLGLTWPAILVVLIIGSLVFPLLGISARVDDRFPDARPARNTLDGTAFMKAGTYSWPSPDSVIELASDYEAIHWLLDNVPGTPVLAEAPAGNYHVKGEDVGYDYYRAGGLRVASLTGLPIFVGHHQYEQRPWDQVSDRTNEAQEFFRTTDLALARKYLRDLRIGYIYIGQLERILFSADSLRKFDVMVDLGDLSIAYRNARVAIYKVER